MKNKSYVISVSFDTGCYRHIKISADAYLDELHAVILDAFDFEDDHAHAFFMDNKAWSDAAGYYAEFLENEERYTSEYKLGDVGLEVGKRFLYIFDFGEEDRFKCKVLKVLEEDTETPVIVKSVGEPIFWDGDFEFCDDEDEEEDYYDEDSIFPETYDDKKLKKMYKALPLPKETVELLKNYFNAFSNLYGIISLKKALEIYNKQNEPLTEETFAAFSEIVRHEENYYCILGADDLYSDVREPCLQMEREIIDESLLVGEDAYEKMKAAHQGKEYYIPSKRTLLKYADANYFDRNPEYNALRDYIVYKLMPPAQKGDDLAEELNCIASMAENNIQEILDAVEQSGIVFQSVEQANEFMKLYMEMANNTRMQTNRGHMPSELRSKGAGLPPQSIVMGPNIKKLIRSGDMNLNEMRRNAETMNFPNEAVRASYFSELDRIEREINDEIKEKHKKR